MKERKVTAPAIDTGISDKDREKIASGLSRLLADTFTVYLKTHNFHWNVTGPMFNTLHLMFETQYNELWAATDPIAERIRSLGHAAPATYAEYSRLASIKETPGQPKAARTSMPPAIEMFFQKLRYWLMRAASGTLQ